MFRFKSKQNSANSTKAASIANSAISMPANHSTSLNTPVPEIHPLATTVPTRTTEQSLDSAYRLPETPAPKDKLPALSLVNTKILTFIVLPLIVAGAAILAFSLLTGEDQNSATSTVEQSFLDALANPTKDLAGGELHINLDTIVEGDKFIIQDASGNDLLVADTKNSRIGIGGFPEGETKLQVLGDIMSSDSLLASGGSTMLSDDGLRIGSVLVCTAAGCKTPPVTGTTQTSGTVIAAGPIDATTLQGSNAAFFLNASNLSSGTLDDSRLSVNITKAGNTFNGPLQLVMTNASGELPAISGVNLTNVNATTLGGNNSSYYTNASNLSSGTVGDGRLSGNVAMRNGFNTFQAGSNSTTAFQIQNAAGTSNLFVADTLNSKLGVGLIPSASGSPLQVGGDIHLGAGGGGSLIFGAGAGDTTLSRYSANSLQTQNFRVNSYLYTAAGHATEQIEMGQSGPSSQAGIKFGTAGDTNLYRYGASGLRTDGEFRSGAGLRVNTSVAGTLVNIGLNSSGGAIAGLTLGDSSDTNLYRSAANVLRTDDNFQVGGTVSPYRYALHEDTGKINIRVDDTGSSNNLVLQNYDIATADRGSGIRFDFSTGSLGSAMYAGAVRLNSEQAWTSTLSTQDSYLTLMTALDGVVAEKLRLTSDGRLVLQGDTNLYRSAANTLKTDDSLNIATKLGIGGDNTASYSLWNQGADASRFTGNVIADSRLDINGGEGIVLTPAAAGTAFRSSISGDANMRLNISHSGLFAWGDGTNPQDTNLYRSAANFLRTDDTFEAKPGDDKYALAAVHSTNNYAWSVYTSALGYPTTTWYNSAGANLLEISGANQAITWQSDTNLYRSGADILATDDTLQMNAATTTIQLRGKATTSTPILLARVAGDTSDRYEVRADGSLLWGPGNTSMDTTLYRSAADILKTDDNFIVQTATNSTTAFQVQNATGTALFIADTTSLTITLGPASATPVILVLGNKNTSGDPATCTAGSVYYNSVSNQAKVCLSTNKWGSINGAFVTALPASANDGDEVYYQADAANSIVWHLRYNAGSASAYKWEFLGGAAMISEDATGGTTASTTYVDVGTAPQVTVLRAGQYKIHFYSEVGPNAGNAALSQYFVRIAPKLGAAVTVDADSTMLQDETATETRGGISRTIVRTLAASDLVKLQARVNQGSGTIGRSGLEIIPIRVN